MKMFLAALAAGTLSALALVSCTKTAPVVDAPSTPADDDAAAVTDTAPAQTNDETAPVSVTGDLTIGTGG